MSMRSMRKLDLFPEKQPDGRLSAEKAIAEIVHRLMLLLMTRWRSVSFHVNYREQVKRAEVEVSCDNTAYICHASSSKSSSVYSLSPTFFFP